MKHYAIIQITDSKIFVQLEILHITYANINMIKLLKSYLNLNFSDWEVGIIHLD